MMGASIKLGMIVQSTGLAMVDRDSSTDTAMAAGVGGPGIATPLIFEFIVELFVTKGLH